MPTRSDILRSRDDILAAARRHDVRAGRLARNADEGAALAAAGFDCLALGTDTQLYQSALAHGIADLRQRMGSARK